MGGHDDDDGAASPLFAYLRTQLPDLLDRAVSEGWKVAVPKASSLRGAAISQALVESHLLRQTAIRDEWKTANGRTVVVVKDPRTGTVRLTTGRGFPVQGNTVDVLAEDLWYGPTSDQGLQLVSVSDTLEKDSLWTIDSFASTSVDKDLPEKVLLQNGAKPGPKAIEGGRSHEELQWCADDKECLAYIESIEGSGEPLMDLEKNLVEFSRTYVFARGYEGETAEKLRKLARDFARATGSDYFDSAYKAALCHTINILESKIWSSLKDLYHVEDMKARTAMEARPRTSQDVDFSEAVQVFEALGNTNSPAMKLHWLDVCVRKHVGVSSSEKQAAVTVFGAGCLGRETRRVVGMDELLPLFIEVVCRAKPAHLMTTYKFLKFFSPTRDSLQMGDFLVSLIESVLTTLCT